MKLTVLGCWAPYPAANEACSGYLLEVAGKRILMELGHGAFGKLQKICDFTKLDAVLISHLHPDHCADLSCLRHAILGAKRLGQELSIPLYTPCEPEDRFQVLANFQDAFELNIVGTNVSQVREIAGLNFTLFPTVHPIPTCGWVVEHDGKKFVYTADTAWEDRLVEFCSQADILLCETSLTQRDAAIADKGHLTAEQAGLLAAQAAAGRLILTHLWPGYNTHQLKNEAASVFGGTIELAVEFGEYL